MSGPAAEVVAVRAAVRRALAPREDATPVLVACSGGADSMAMAAATAWVCRAVRPVHALVVDHGLQAGSGERAEETARLLRGLGIAAQARAVRVAGRGGPEAAARTARYTALRAALPSPDSPVLLGHTLDDQAETVLLGLGRGSGARSLAGMPGWDPPWLRPLLGVRRSVTRAACAALGLPVWDDPHNVDPRFTRVRLRTEVLPLLEEVLAGGVAEALARTAAQLRDDSEALDGWAAEALVEAGPARPGAQASPEPGAGSDIASDGAASIVEAPTVAETTITDRTAGAPGRRKSIVEGIVAGSSTVRPNGPRSELEAKALVDHPAAVRRRVLRDWLLGLGVPELSDSHLRRADDLVGDWRGQGGVHLPGGLVLQRRHGRLAVTSAPPRRHTVPRPSVNPGGAEHTGPSPE